MLTRTKVTADLVSLPKSGGAVAGMGETFTPDPFTGTVDISVPIVLSPGRNGFGPNLSLHYSTGHPNGIFGLGWKISIPQIQRKTQNSLPRYLSDDTYIVASRGL